MRKIFLVNQSQVSKTGCLRGTDVIVAEFLILNGTVETKTGCLRHFFVITAEFLILNVILFGQKLDASEMLPHIASVRQAVRFAVSDFKGKELPGFSIPKKVSNHV